MARNATPRRRNADPLARTVLLALFGVFVFLIVRDAWLSDDAYITLRTVDHFIHGRGLVYNVDERVQTYTHPLWMLVLSGIVAITREFYHSCTVGSIVASAAAAALLAFGAFGRSWQAVLGIAVLCASKAFVDFSTSGLENPLTHVLLAGFCVLYLRRSEATTSGTRALAALSGLAMLNRLDVLILLAPAWLEMWARGPRSEWGRSLWRPLAIGLAPVLLWEVFAVVYYGFPLPNTAYAKVWTGIPTSDLMQQGLFYLANSVRLDPITLAVIAASAVVAARSRDRRLLALAAGSAAYLVYNVRVGGDFMSGRFLSAPLALALVVVCRGLSGRAVWGALAAVLVLGVISPASPLRGGASPAVPEDAIDAHGVSDERAFYAPWAALRAGPQDATLRTYKRSRWGLAWREQARAARAEGRTGTLLVTTDAIGYSGFFAGPAVRIVDRPALADPYLARRPVAADPPWRIGHFFREIPDDYMETLSTGRNALRDPAQRELYENVVRVTRGPLWDRRRWQAIWELNRP